MKANQEYPELSWAAWIIRLAMISLFLVAAVGKWKMGVGPTAENIMNTFKGTWLPGFLVAPYAYAITFVETLLAVWLLVGYKLRWAWIVSGVLLVSLAFGMLVVGQYAIASANYIYAVIACAGLILSRYDACCIGGCCCKKS